MMQVVIDIPDDEYGIIKACTAPMTWAEHLIMNGTPLPKGHGRLIDADNITSITLEDSLHCLTWKRDSEIDCYIDAPIIIEADKESEGL